MTRHAVVVAILKYPGETVDPTQPAITAGPPSSNEITVTVTGDGTSEIRPGALASIAVAARSIFPRRPAADGGTLALSGRAGASCSSKEDPLSGFGNQGPSDFEFFARAMRRQVVPRSQHMLSDPTIFDRVFPSGSAPRVASAARA